MSETWVKSRDCSPSSKTIGERRVEQSRGEDRGDAGVGVGERLALAVDVEEAQGHGGDPVGGAGDQRHLLVVALVDRVDRGRQQRLGLAGRHRPQRPAALGAGELPLAGQQLLLGARPRGLVAVGLAGVLALAVDRHRGGDDEPARQRAQGDQALEEAGGGHRVQLGVAGDLIHRLADADGGGQVHDAVDPARARSAARVSPTSPTISSTEAGRSGSAPPWTCSSIESSTTTSSPRPTSSRTICEPMNPAPPVTSVLIAFATPKFAS